MTTDATAPAPTPAPNPNPGPAPAPAPDDRYIVISADCHGGGNLRGYRPYLENRWLDDFDAWAAGYTVPYDDLKGDLGGRNWDSDRRLADLEADGIVAEVIYPNTVPPFYPNNSLVEQPPAPNAGDLERRWAGLRAHNRWMADFCAAAPGRRAGICQIMLHDLDAAVAEVRWAKENGLFGGVLLPGAPPGSGVPSLYDPEYYEPLWSVCEELDMPVNHHSGSAAPAAGERAEDKVILLLEVTWWAHRAFTHLLVGGVFERHPGLRLVLAEQGTAWVPEELARLDYFFDRMGTGTADSQEAVWGKELVGGLSLRPSEFFARQVRIGASFLRGSEVPAASRIGFDKIMWGSDYPHREGSHPYSREALRAAFAGVAPVDVERMLAGNAATTYGFDLDALRPLADWFGPRVAEVAEPLKPASLPIEAEMCPALIGYGKEESS
ncbi:amidohydrolase family protein [Pseudofrankia sp. BMG5.36]|uniref:amidohydrolase family protein n=1 Tax=Pseudofrankia sp. BMG5.36 TaxID=1834512 RepID=UPI0009F49A0E|nr:amidohydrolase family protein [Pseudofrankia sp. BMG5.36]